MGMRLAGIEVVASYERWGIANETNFKNNKHQAQTVDIRRLDLNDLPKKIDIVVGSPPCTQFSFSNRGGSGDITDGLQDIIKFLEIVDYIKPKFWAMENVPRVAKILERELRYRGRLEKFKHLEFTHQIINMEKFGLPQRRQRCIAGNFDFELLNNYSETTPTRTLGQVIEALTSSPSVDTIYGITLDNDELRDHIPEEALNDEEVRINLAGKTLHPVYNSMTFPDRLDRSVRTITATCTRVSRESIVIECPEKPGFYRRLTVRERACLQGFPITFQFYGDSYAQKIRMVGNALPPLISYYIGQTFKRLPANKIKLPNENTSLLKAPATTSTDAKPEKPGFHYPKLRTFRFAIPSLRLKSGVRFELANIHKNNNTEWGIGFYFGNSKSIQTLPLDGSTYSQISKAIPTELRTNVNKKLSDIVSRIQKADISNMQKIWSHNGLGLTTPFTLLDWLDNCGSELVQIFNNHEILSKNIVSQTVWRKYGEAISQIPGIKKLEKNAPLIISGLLIGSICNTELPKRISQQLTKKTGSK